MTLINNAVNLAYKAHEGQTYDDQPYVTHLRSVVLTLTEFGFEDPEHQAAGWLHDVVEDTSVTFDQLALMFPQEVLDIVWAVTNEPGRNRKERFATTYPKIRASQSAIAVKLADRISNVEASLRVGKGKYRHMYKEEYPTFRAELFPVSRDLRLKKMWAHLDRLIESC